ncbi:GNAT family N-acetyltransferase [Paraherbaspirillum soli]|uniref:GNAT family N-acetyltransferase n=1 Tax=Paraherbaspirillum soli TaxID=631222 RepID=A0ABW0MG66_9BURK
MGIFVRELQRSDMAVVNRWRNRQELVADLGGVFRFVGEEVDEKWFDHYLSVRNNNVRLAICDERTQQTIGLVYLLGIDWINRAGECAIWIGEAEARGRGVGLAAMQQLLNHAFNDLNLHRIHLTVLANNQRALGLYKKVGFVEEGFLRQAVFKDGRYQDLIQMAILAHEFESI